MPDFPRGECFFLKPVLTPWVEKANKEALLAGEDPSDSDPGK